MSTPPHAAPIAHYENFPVASWLCPPNLRAPIAAIYHFARTADDIADEGDAPAAERLADLAAYRQALHAAARGSQAGSRWPGVFDALAYAIQAFHLPVPLLEDLLDAFVQDVGKTRDGAGYTDQAELLDYCRRSANPIGRLLLHLYGVADLESLRMSDAICSALQLVNFWQDLSRDIPRGRFYLPEADCAAHGVDRAMLAATSATPAVRELVAAQAAIAQALMLQGAPLVHRVPGRAGWELRLVVQGGLRILERIARQRFDTLCQRPHIGGADTPVLLWRALRM